MKDMSRAALGFTTGGAIIGVSSSILERLPETSGARQGLQNLSSYYAPIGTATGGFFVLRALKELEKSARMKRR